MTLIYLQKYFYISTGSFLGQRNIPQIVSFFVAACFCVCVIIVFTLQYKTEKKKLKV